MISRQISDHNSTHGQILSEFVLTHTGHHLLSQLHKQPLPCPGLYRLYRCRSVPIHRMIQVCSWQFLQCALRLLICLSAVMYTSLLPALILAPNPLTQPRTLAAKITPVFERTRQTTEKLPARRGSGRTDAKYEWAKMKKQMLLSPTNAIASLCNSHPIPNDQSARQPINN